ncbi:hypothetical protein EES41_18205 [Streptomyces sp. ADI95-16]|uniref:DUF6344 domain-containing protein n=1 Tax=Streptomyces sp. ADI95-16 TaxID=1522758 RepID=UPI000F3A9A06|nr:DUF6344 domain-containing protein [Streptomyces sp. ADI95-16]AYV28644.1 hypothetical protein EES41_18205 [Streptomyces sp. ADI95-16]
MAHRSTTSIWTTVLAALVALFAILGFARKTAPAAASAAGVPVAAAVPATAAVRRPVMMARRTWRAMMRGGSLPPTIKQRIRAEAHGKTPSVRRSTTAAAALSDGAPAGASAGTPTGATGRSITRTSAAMPAGASAGAARDALALAA